jgi:hypothetical protein
MRWRQLEERQNRQKNNNRARVHNLSLEVSLIARMGIHAETRALGLKSNKPRADASSGFHAGEALVFYQPRSAHTRCSIVAAGSCR